VSGFIPTPADGWPLIAEMLTASGQRWPESAAITDLRFYADAAAFRLGVSKLRTEQVTDADREAIRAALPGRPALVKRWGWSDWAVKQLRAAPELWWDSARWGAQRPTASAPPAGRQPTTSAPPAEVPVNAEDSDGSASPPPALRQPTASPPPSRAVPCTTNPPTTHHKEDSVPAPPVQPTLVGPPAPPKVDPHREAWHTAALFWGSQVLPACGRKPSSGPESPSKGIGSKLMTAVRNDADAVLDALRFVAWSQHSRALHFRGERYDLDTVLRHVEAYSGLWREFGDNPAGGTQQRRFGGPAPPSAGDGALDRLWAKEQARKLAEDGGPDEDDEE
jgi:hypothetical protein